MLILIPPLRSVGCTMTETGWLPLHSNAYDSPEAWPINVFQLMSALICGSQYPDWLIQQITASGSTDSVLRLLTLLKTIGLPLERTAT